MFKDVLKSEMERLNYTAPELAIKLELYGKDGKPNKQRVYDYLKGTEPPFEILIKLSKIFNVSIDYLLGESKYKTKADDLHLPVVLPENLKEIYIELTSFMNKIFTAKINTNNHNALNALCNFIAWLSFYPNGIDDDEFFNSCCEATDGFDEMLEKYNEERRKLKKTPIEIDVFDYLYKNEHFFKLQYEKMSKAVYESFFGGDKK